MHVNVSFADLTHTGQVVAANTFPIGATMIAAYAKKRLGDEIAFEIFRYPHDFTAYLDHTMPQLACFTVFAWNQALAHEYARRIKAASPRTITIFGGANVPAAHENLPEYLAKYEAIDFCVEGEGEEAFVELFKLLKAHNFDAGAIKAKRLQIPNTRYLVDGKLVVGPMLPRIVDLNEIPSVYAGGLSDKFFDDNLIPMIQSTRGCPYACTFCHEGSVYYNKTRRVTQERVRWELDYIAERVKVPDFIITDLNFGMFEADIDTTKKMAELQETKDWPKFVTIATAKNHKDRVLEISKLLKGALPPGAAVQSTDPEVLKTIKRKNLPLEAVVAVARTAETDGAVSFSEIILCLPGDSRRAYIKSVTDTVDAGFTLVRSYQFMLLNGTEAADKESREKFAMQTRFRVKPMNFGIYRFRDEQFGVAEIEEICVGNSTMPHEDYLVCRALSLTVEIFNNNGIFFDLTQFLAQRGIHRSTFLLSVHDRVVEGDGVISSFYDGYRRDEERNMWRSGDELEAFLSQPGTIEEYLQGEYGTNEIYKYRALAVFDHVDKLHNIAFAVARSLFAAKGTLDALTELYLSELKEFALSRKGDVLNTEVASAPRLYHFDFIRLVETNFALDPFSVYLPEGIMIETYHTDKQRRTIDGYLRQFGGTLVGRGRILNRAHIASMYRTPRRPARLSRAEVAAVTMPA